MIKKIVATTLISAMSLFALPNSEMELYMVNKAIEKKAIVLSNMQLKQESKEAFGKLYDEYQKQLMIQRRDEVELIEAYADNYKTLTDENANLIIQDWQQIETQELALKKEYMLKFSRVLSSADVIRYFQIENRLQLLKEVQVSSLIPLAQNAVVEKEIEII